MFSFGVIMYYVNRVVTESMQILKYSVLNVLNSSLYLSIKSKRIIFLKYYI